MIDFDDALEEAIRSTGVERYRFLCSEANALPPPNDRESWRRFILEGRWRPETSYPSVATMVGNALGAAGRFVASGLQTVAPEEFERRHAICEACDQFVAAEDRCRACGCWLAIKPWGARESCPIGKW
jgi:hypothetical protein